MPYILRDSQGAEIGRSSTPIVITGSTAAALGERWMHLPDGCTVEVVADPPPVPAEVTMRQARLALLAAGKLDDVEAAIDALPEGVTRTAARIAWDYSSMVERHNGLVATLAPAIGLNDAAIDALFIGAATV